uniref:SJCHGC04139 protein n=1 Tax=Schistosoma japonicum TaxID=6182 RepID=Q5DB95_SCHJA|nr:SJCHGC04139 protein [Schistosoma japonicum]
MTSHLTRMQYEQHRLNSLGRTGSSSSLRSGDPVRVPSASSIRPVNQLINQEPTGSIVSGSYISFKSRSQTSSVGNAYQNIIRSTRQMDPSIHMSSNLQTMENETSILANNSSRTGSISGYQPSVLLAKSTQGTRSLYAPSHFRMSRSLKASKASLATYKSGRTTIQAEHHDRKVQREINSVKFGRAKKLYWIAVGFYIMFLLVLFVGLLITCLRHVYMNIILSLDIGELTGPLLIACSFLFFGAGMKFYYDAYRLGSEERKFIKYKAASPSTVAVTTIDKRMTDAEEKLVSGQISKNALSRAPIGSRTTLIMP